MRWTLITLLATTGTAAATPIEPLWEATATCERLSLSPWGESLAWIDRGKIRRIDRATGKLGPVLSLPKLASSQGARVGWADAARVEAVTGDAIVVHAGHSFGVVDAKGALRWQADQGNDGGLPRLHVTGGDVIWIHASNLQKGDAVRVERLAIASGTSLWKAAADPDTGQIEWSDTDGKWLYVLTRPDAIGPKNFLAVFDVATGKRAWSRELTGRAKDQGSGGTRGLIVELAGGGLIYSDGTSALHVLDGATGAPRPELALPEPATSLATDGTSLYVVTPGAVTAFDLAKRTTRWTQRRSLERLLAATRAGVFGVSNGYRMLRALDPETGIELASWGVAGSDLIYTATDGGAPLFVACEDGKRLFALDPTGAVQPSERATITGTLECPSCGKRKRFFPPTEVTLGDARATTDRRGRFRLQLEGRGQHELFFGLPEIPSPAGWAGADGNLVRLRGKRTYALGRINVRVDCGPMEPPCL